jgi:integrase
MRLGGQEITVTRPTEKEARAEAMAIKAGIIKQKRAPDRITLETAYKRYIETKEGVLSPSTVAGYKRLSSNTFQPLMQRQISVLTNESIQREISAMKKAGKSPKYIANASGLLSSVLKMFAPDFRYSVVLPQREKPELRTPDDKEIDAIMCAVRGTDVELPVLMAIWMGMRMSEIRGAQYGDISGGKLYIRRAIVDDENGAPVVKTTKTTAGKRRVSIPSYIASLIPPSSDPEEYIVKASGQAIYKRFTRVLENAGIPHMRFHDLRHVNAAVMVRLGVESRYAQERNGWSSDRMYKQVYAYTMHDKMDAVDESINTYFANKIAK